jgi:hypothetical protein
MLHCLSMPLLIRLLAAWALPNASAKPGLSSSFEGRLLGVHAQVTLDRAARVAALNLYGIPLGGHLAGVARFDGRVGDRDSFGSVVLDEPLARALRKRFVVVTNVHETRDCARGSELVVELRLPLVGTRRLRLRPVTEASRVTLS